ncbi:MAG TPA: type II toxin-antitoxin system PemK/MazF family toxin [Polyangiaceae bacterium]|nr:type II toxin-antitoxin system PemK/MazF family toxin [Polyangiaceae bacterium]
MPHSPSETAASPALISRGDVHWLDSEDGAGLAHPHVVVQDDVFNRSRISSVVVCALTSNLHRASEPGNVLLENGEASLPQRSVVVVSQICSVDKARLGAKIGVLSQARVDQILAGLRFQQRSFFDR